MNYLILLFITFFLSACSFSSPVNQWQHKSVSAYESYVKNFLSANDAMANNDLQRAIEHSKKSSNLDTLGRIYLGQCALNIAFEINDKCENYNQISDVINNKALDAYYSLITSTLKKEQIEQLPDVYQEFATKIVEENFEDSIEAIQNFENPSSIFISASLVKKYLTSKDIEQIIEKASFYGYKKGVIYWLKKLSKITTDLSKKSIIIKKIAILESKN